LRKLTPHMVPQYGAKSHCVPLSILPDTAGNVPESCTPCAIVPVTTPCGAGSSGPRQVC